MTTVDPRCRKGRAAPSRIRREVRLVSDMPGSPVAYVLDFHETVGGRCSLVLEAHMRVPDHATSQTSWKAGSPAEALELFKTYDAAADVPVAIDPDSPELSAAEMIAHALHLRALMDVANRTFGQLVREFADELEEPPEQRDPACLPVAGP